MQKLGLLFDIAWAHPWSFLSPCFNLRFSVCSHPCSVLHYNECATISACICGGCSGTLLCGHPDDFFFLSGTPCLRNCRKFADISDCVNVGTWTVAQISNYYCLRNVESLKKCRRNDYACIYTYWSTRAFRFYLG